MTTRNMVFGQDNWPTDYPGDSNTGADKVTGTAADNIIDGGPGKDTINGGAGDDTITGGKGADVLTGGPGFDTFVFNHGDSLAIAPDKLVDFNPAEDFLDLKGVDANITQSGDQDFNFITGPFTHHAGELRIDTAVGQLQGDVDGN